MVSNQQVVTRDAVNTKQIRVRTIIVTDTESHHKNCKKSSKREKVVRENREVIRGSSLHDRRKVRKDGRHKPRPLYKPQ